MFVVPNGSSWMLFKWGRGGQTFYISMHLSLHPQSRRYTGAMPMTNGQGDCTSRVLRLDLTDSAETLPRIAGSSGIIVEYG